MGFYLNNKSAFIMYQNETKGPYFVDKSGFLAEMIPLVEQSGKNICVTRPRRFGKSVMATMIGAYFGKGADAALIFDRLKIAGDAKYREHLNKHNLVYIDFSKGLSRVANYADFIGNITEKWQRDLHKEFTDVDFLENGDVIEDLTAICQETGERFVFVFDEWDCIFHKPYMNDDSRHAFVEFISDLTKGQPYVELTYMTGILPISKYSSGSSLNHFEEHSMAKASRFDGYFGFTEEEVDELYVRYLRMNGVDSPVTREGLRYWYDGYHMPNGMSMYNPRSVVLALVQDCLQSYWTHTGPYDEIAYFIVNNIDGVKKDVALLIDGASVPADFYNAVSTTMKFATKDEIFSAMVIYGFLNYEKGTVRIPNKELTDEFADTIRRNQDLGYIYRLARASDRMLEATLDGDTETMEKIFGYAHNTETPILSYNSEVELAALVNLVYLSARNRYRVVREQKAGKGFADFVFYPYEAGQVGIILELKVGDTPENAIAQIREKQYAHGFETGANVGGLCGCPPCTGGILLVGIGYDKETKEHRCLVQEYDPKM